jgi:hypothetical protein
MSMFPNTPTEPENRSELRDAAGTAEAGDGPPLECLHYCGSLSGLG